MHCAGDNVYNIVVDQGASLLRAISLKSSARAVVTITGYTARMKVREKVTDTAVILSATTSNGMLEINGTTGTVNIIIPPATTAAILAGNYVYDLEVEETSTGITTRIIQGKFTVRAEVTR